MVKLGFIVVEEEEEEEEDEEEAIMCYDVNGSFLHTGCKGPTPPVLISRGFTNGSIWRRGVMYSRRW